MVTALKIKKSAGVPVTAAVHSLIKQGNDARDRKDWTAAEAAYEQALAQAPDLAHIWVQLGHAAKEHKNAAKAEKAYLRAVELKPGDVSPFLYLAKMARVSGDEAAAGRYYYRAALADPNNDEAVSELHRLVTRSSNMTRETMLEIMKENTPMTPDETTLPLEGSVQAAQSSIKAVLSQLDDADANSARLRETMALLDTLDRKIKTDSKSETVEAKGQAALVFDISDLIGYYTHARLPTGIQRVQIEAITSALNDSSRTVRVCCFIDGRDDWLEVPAAQFRYITQLSVKGEERNDAEWVGALNKLRLALTLAEPFTFPDGAYLINLGTSWWLHNYFLFVRHAKAKHGIRYIPFVHDFIPIITPEHCVKGLTQDFISWAVGVFAHADHYLVNSEATKRDLLKVSAILGGGVDADDVAVIRLDADFRKPDARPLPRSALAKWRLDEQPYVLLVSTVESRKGHVAAMDAWLELIRRHGARKTPMLVCVGKNGWLNDTVYQRLGQNPELEKRVTMLANLPDDELALLYRNCQFTIYPSLYEGWGLPITESLCYGKPVIAANSSSLPEAGGEFAVYVEPGSASQLADAVEKMSFDTASRKKWEAKIATGFRPRTWKDVARQIDQEISKLVARTKDDKETFHAPMAKLGAYHPITRNIETRIWPGLGSGEIFRAGIGWIWPDTWGCWTRPQGGELVIGVPKGHKALRIYMLIKNFPNHECQWRLDIKGARPVIGTLRNGEQRWISFDYPELDDGGVLRMRLRGNWSEIVRMNTGGTDKDYLVSVGLAGFYICEADDQTARNNLMEALALGAISDLDAYREYLPAEDITEIDWDRIGLDA